MSEYAYLSGGRFRRFFKIFAVAFALFCVVPAGPVEAGATDLWDTKISVQDECPITGREQLATTRGILPIVASAAVSLFQTLLPKAVDIGLSYAASEAKKAARADNSIVEVSGLGRVDGFYQLSQEGDDTPLGVASYLADKCLVVARGLYGPREAGSSFSGKPWEDQAVQTRLASLGLRENPGIYLEARFRVSPDGTHFRIEPLRFFFERPLHDGTEPNEDFDTAFEFKFQAPAGGSTKTFALGNLILRNVVRGENLKEEALAVTSTGWMPILPRTSEITSVVNRVAALYTQKGALAETIANTEEDVKRLAASFQGAPETGTGLDARTLFEAVKAQAKEDLANDMYDDDYFAAFLDTQPSTAATSNVDAAARAARKLERRKQLLARNRDRKELRLRRNQAKSGLEKLMLLDVQREALAAVTAEIKVLESDTPVFAPVNIIVSIKEQISKPENTFLMTAAEILEGSKEGIKQTIAQHVTPEGREQLRQARIAELSARADLVVAAMEARRVAEEREIAFDALPTEASKTEILNAKHTLETAKIRANIAALKAGLSLPYRDVHGLAE